MRDTAMTRKQRFSYALLAAAFAVTVASCASSPEALFSGGGGGELQDFAALPQGGVLYMAADARSLEPLLDAAGILKDAQVRKMAQATTAAAAVFFTGREDKFFAVFRGKYPKAGINSGLGLSAGWKKKRSPAGGRYWHSAERNLSLAAGSSIAVVSQKDPFAFAPARGLGAGAGGSAADIAPERFGEFSRGAALSGWIPIPADRINGILEKAGVPLQIPAEEFSFALFPLPGGDWEIAAMVKTPAPSQAKALLTLFSMARLLMPGLGGGAAGGGAGVEGAGVPAFSLEDAIALFLANSPAQDGIFLTLRSGPLDLDTAALLFRALSVYWSGGAVNKQP